MRKEMKKGRIVLTAAVLAGVMGLSGCNSSGGSTEVTEPASRTEAEKAENKEEATERKEDEETSETVEEKEMKDQAIIVVSFGTSYNESRDATIGAIEQAVTDAFPEFTVYRAFTSQMIIDKLKERDGLDIDNIEEALDRAESDGVKRLVVQPTHLMDGFEYMDVKAALEAYTDKFEDIVLAKPLLAEDKDYRAVAQAIMEATSSYDDGETAICFMGHGTEADANAVYPKLQEELQKTGSDSCHYYIGTVEAEPTLEDVIEAMKASGDYRRVVLEPLMIVAGDHANKDMAGDDEDSWKSVLEAEGYEVECILKGLGEIPAIRDIYVAHAQEAVDGLN